MISRLLLLVSSRLLPASGFINPGVGIGISSGFKIPSLGILIEYLVDIE